jgi:hypothetical protein
MISLPKDVSLYPDGRMDTRTAAAYLGLSPKTLAMKRSTGTGPRFIKRGRVFYYRDDCDKWLKEGLATSTTQSRLAASTRRTLKPGPRRRASHLPPHRTR